MAVHVHVVVYKSQLIGLETFTWAQPSIDGFDDI